MESKNITIQIWTDLYYTRTIGIWYPDAPEVEAPAFNEEPSTIKFNDAPYLIVLSGTFTPRQEVQGFNPIAPGQHPIPKDFLESQIRHMSYLFANEFGIFQPKSKAHAKTFIAKQTVSYKMDKEIELTVSPATGSMSLKDLRDSIDQYTEEEQREIKVITVGEHPKDADAKGIENFIHTQKQDGQRQYISVTKLTPVYEIENSYIDKTSLPADPAFASLPPGTDEAPLSQDIISGVAEARAEDASNREALETFDRMIEPVAVMDEETGEPTVNEDGEPVMVVPEVDRIAVLEQMLKDKDQQLIDAGLKNPPIEKTEQEEIPAPMSEADLFPYADQPEGL